MDLHADVTAPCPIARVHDELAELDGYPTWLGIIRAVTRDGDGWVVELAAALGPLRRSKRVRMVRTIDQPDHVRFERRESDGSEHPPWILDVTLAERDGSEAATFTSVSLHYGGAAWVPGLDLLLGAEVRRAGPRLIQRLTDVQ